MIRSVEIENLRGIQSGELKDLSRLVILVGQNNSGKSTILEALLIGGSLLTGKTVDELTRRRSRRRGNMKNGMRWLLWKAGQGGTGLVTVTTDVDTFRKVFLLPQPVDAASQIKIEGRVIDGDHGIDKNDETSFLVSDSSASFALEPKPLDGISAVRLVDFDSASQSIPLHQVYTMAVERGRRKEVQALLAVVVPGLNSIDILTEGDAPIVYLVFDDYAVPVAMAGDGIQSLLRLVLELAACPNGVVLLEEPEVHQHPGSLAQSARAIHAAVRRGIQVILTTHSLDLIDTLLSEADTPQDLNNMSVYHLLLREGCLKYSRLNGSEVAFARGTIQDDMR